MDWYFVPRTIGIQPAEAIANPLANSVLSPAELLARESLQNSIDETLDGQNLRFIVRRHLLIGEQKQALLDHFQLSSIAEKASCFEDGKSSRWFKDGFAAIEGFARDEPIPVLEVADYNAHGLTGRWYDGQTASDRFFNLVLSEYRTKKALDGRKLGSYGIGKIVFARASDIRTVIYYSKFKPDDASEGNNTRLMSVAYLPEFRYESKSYAGYAYFGEESKVPEYPRCPVTGDNADSIISSMGMDVRHKEELGTSVFIPFCNIDVNEFATAIEKWWWPYLETQSVIGGSEIIVKDENGKKRDIDHNSRSDLAPFLRIHRDMAAGFANGETHIEKVNASTPKRRFAGDFGAQEVPKKNDSELNNNVALIRRGLVIAYANYFKNDQRDCAGVFNSSEESSPLFVSAEPEAHDRWNYRLSRLEDYHGEEGTRFIKSALTQIEAKAVSYQLQKKDIPEKAQDSLDFLDSALAVLLKPKKKGGREIEHLPRVPFIRKAAKRSELEGKFFDEIEFELGLKEGDDDVLDYELNVSIATLVDSTGAPGEKILSTVTLTHGGVYPSAEHNKIPVRLKDDETLSGTARASVSNNWSTVWTIALEPRERT